MIAGRYVIGRPPRVANTDANAQLESMLGGNFAIVHGEPPPYIRRTWRRYAYTFGRQTVNVESIPPPVTREFAPMTCYIGVQVINAPAVKKTSSILELGRMGRDRGGIIKWYRPKTTRSMKSEECRIYRFGNKTKAMYYPKNQTLVMAWMGYGYRTYAAVEVIMDRIRGEFNPVGIDTLPPQEIPHITLTIGADPEFEILDAHGVVIHPNAALYPNRSVSAIGIDGAGSQLELRPTAGTIETVVGSITTLMKAVKHRLSTIGDKYPLGGHIHIGYGFRYRPPEELLWLLDQYLGMPTCELSGTARGYYKGMGNIEDKPHGFEYRTPPAAIFESPRFTELSMKIALNVCERYANCESFFVRQYGVAKDEYVNYGVLTGMEYDEWERLLTSYPWHDKQHDCRLNWALPDQLSEPHERIKTPDELREERRVAEEMRVAEQRRQQERTATQAAQDARRMVSREEQQRRDNDMLAAQTLDHAGIVFGDDWAPEALVFFRDEIRMLTESDIQLFGLAENRGDVTYGYSVDGYNRLVNAENSTWTGRCGVPWRVRMNQAGYAEMREHVAAICAEREGAIAENNRYAAEIAENVQDTGLFAGVQAQAEDYQAFIAPEIPASSIWSPTRIQRWQAAMRNAREAYRTDSCHMDNMVDALITLRRELRYSSIDRAEIERRIME
jgi:hypothetical protein